MGALMQPETTGEITPPTLDNSPYTGLGEKRTRRWSQVAVLLLAQIPPREVADRLGISRQAVYSIIRSLLSRGIITIIPGWWPRTYRSGPNGSVIDSVATRDRLNLREQATATSPPVRCRIHRISVRFT